jgi:glutaminase
MGLTIGCPADVKLGDAAGFGAGGPMTDRSDANVVIPDFQRFRQDLEAIFDEAATAEGGKVADYIPQLGRVDPDQFGVAACTIDGQRWQRGDADVDFCVQSCCKPINYALALEAHGEAYVHRHVGREPSGRGFNELALNADGLPHNPLVNAGGIMCCALLAPNAPIADRFDYVMDRWRALAGGTKPGFSNATYLSERATADRNFALGYYMQERKAFPPGTHLLETLEFYFQCCSIEQTCASLSVVAATLANGGVCPITGEVVLQPKTVQHTLSLMSSCGLYDFSGEFAFTIGLPAKSGVAGAILVVVPNVLGFAVWSPRLDRAGNSVRGVAFCRGLVERFNFHPYDSLTGASSKRDPRRRDGGAEAAALVHAASVGDLAAIRRFAARHVPLDAASHDGRTALHLAAADGHLEVVRYLLASGVAFAPRDRWGHTPLDDARRAGQAEIVAALTESAKRAPSGDGGPPPTAPGA